MIILGIDTCLSACSAAVADDQRVVAWRTEEMARGHQERLAPLVQAVMQDAALAFDRLERIGVTVGPGSFTGLRVGLAFAKGLGAALGVPVVGIGALEALAFGRSGLTFAAIDARRDQIYLQGFEDGRALMAPVALSVVDAKALIARLAGRRPATFIGSGGVLLSDGLLSDGHEIVEASGADPRAVAALAARAELTPATPIYLRAPDAKLPTAKTPNTETNTTTGGGKALG